MKANRCPKVAALIDIGSSETRMQIAQVRKGKMDRIEALSYPVALGRDVYATGRVSQTTVRELIKALEGFLNVIREYAVSDVTAVTTTALRRAKNRDLVLDQVKIRTGIDIRVLEDNEEKSLIYYEMIRTLRESSALPDETTLFSFVGSGSVGIAFYNGRTMYDSMTVPTGALQLGEMFRSIQQTTDDFGHVIADYIHSMLTYDNLEVDCRNIRHVVFTGSMISVIAAMTDCPFTGGMYRIPVEKMRTLYDEIRAQRPESIAIRYKVSIRIAEMLYLSLALYLSLVSFTQADTVLSPRSVMSDCLIRSVLIPAELAAYRDYLLDIVLSCAATTADFYHCNKAHSEYIRDISLKMFDRLSSQHSLSQRDRAVLELACVLHECGHAVSARHHLQSGYDVIRHTDLIGATKGDMLLAATIARYNELEEPDLSDPEFESLPEDSRTRAAKLTAIFRAANALDNTHTEKLSDITVRMREETLEIAGRTNENMYLERYAFEQCAAYFTDVFGTGIRLRVRSALK
ncbi:MAG: hypothetical protein PUE04_03645 [Lachnospira sp.]|nr:hypothetical protein [Lachnospira sp.]